MQRLIVNIDVPDLEPAIAFYTSAFGLRTGRRFKGPFVELLGAPFDVYLLEKAGGGSSSPGGGARDYSRRHWSPVHLDIVVDDLAAAVEKVLSCGARAEGEALDLPFGRLAMFADPFGHGFCLIEFNECGYEALILHM